MTLIHVGVIFASALLAGGGGIFIFGKEQWKKSAALAAVGALLGLGGLLVLEVDGGGVTPSEPASGNAEELSAWLTEHGETKDSAVEELKGNQTAFLARQLGASANRPTEVLGRTPTYAQCETPPPMGGQLYNSDKNWSLRREVLQDSSAKGAVLFFCASWCEPCKAMLKQVRRFKDKLASSGFKPVMIAMSSRKRMEELVSAAGPKMDVISVGPLTNETWWGSAVFSHLPRTVVLDKKGRVTEVFGIQGHDFESRLMTALKQSGQACDS